MNDIVYSNLFYFSYINQIGGIESWFYYIAKKYGKYDITVAYSNGDRKQLNRLARYVRVIRWTPGIQIMCKNLFVNFNTDIVPYCIYDNLVFFAHGDYKDMLVREQMKRQDIDRIIQSIPRAKYYGLSKLVADSWKEITGIDMKVCYNPIDIDKPKKLIRICSAQRMTKEKGLSRIIKLVNELDNYARVNNVLWEWDIYTNDVDKVNNPNVHYKKPTLDIMSYIPRYDWFAILSDNEGFCYGAIESLLSNVPVIKTPCPVFDELELNDDNSVTLDFECSNVKSVVEKLYVKRNKFVYNVPKDGIGELLLKTPSTYSEERKEMILVRATKQFEKVVDKEEGRVRTYGEEWFVSKDRCNELVSFIPPLVEVVKYVK